MARDEPAAPVAEYDCIGSSAQPPVRKGVTELSSHRALPIRGALGLALFVPLLHAQEGRFNRHHAFVGSAADGGLGSAVAGLGDLNGDGYPELIVGASEADPGGKYGAGSATVYSGKDGSTIWQFRGGTAFDGLGAAVDNAGDVDGDGVADLIVGAPMSFLGRSSTGSAYVYSGADGSTLWRFDGAEEEDHLGYAVAGAGDVNRDGHADLIVGAPNSAINPTRSGSVYVYSGEDGSTLHRFEGDRAGDYFGSAVGAAGDINQDGVPDIIAGAPGAAAGGMTRVYSGSDGSIIWQFDGNDVGHHSLGSAVAGAGDVNRDGYPDVIIGAPSAEPGGFAAAYSGADGSTLWQLEGESVGGYYLGSSVAPAGDVNRDGFADLIIGAAQANPGGVFRAGTVYVYSGKTGAQIWQLDGQSYDEHLGIGVAAAGDVNQDGFPDVIIGASGTDTEDDENTGSAYVYVFKVAAAIHLSGVMESQYQLEGSGQADGFGFSVDGAGDVNRDGYADVIVGAPETGGRGYARVTSGRDGAELLEFRGRSIGDELGAAVAATGDINGDGYADVIVGAPFAGSFHAGAAHVFSGKDGVELHKFRGSSPGDELGSAVSGAGDVDDDGILDLIVGAPYGGGNGRGAMFLYSGADGSRLLQIHGTSSGDEFGCAVAAVGDVNRDGHADVLVGARYTGDDRAGAAFVYSGADGVQLFRFSGAAAEDHLGSAVAAAGDINRDGYPDLIVGAPGTEPDGSADVYSGKDGTRLWQFSGDLIDELSLGGSVDGAGDVNRDGFDDVIVGASRACGGSARIYSGKDGTMLWRFDPDAPDDLLGWSVAGAGDVNRDGFPDVIVGTHMGNTGRGAATVYTYDPAFRWYGTPTAGTGNIAPRLGTGGEMPELGSLTFRIQLTEAVGSALCGIAVSVVQTETPFLGGTLYGDFTTPGNFAVWGFTTNGRAGVPGVGSATLPFRIPGDPAMVGFTTYWQGFVVDPGSPLDIGLSHTDGLAVTVVY